MSAPEPGWFDDPEDPSKRRYWDGQQWTDHRADRRPEPDQPPARKTGCLTVAMWTFGILIVLAALGSIGGDDDQPARTPTSPQTSHPADPASPAEERKGDSGARLACAHFRNVARDAAAGVLSENELREKLREVYDDARVSEDRRFGTAAQDMLAGLTSGDEERFDRGLEDFDAACDSIDL